MNGATFWRRVGRWVTAALLFFTCNVFAHAATVERGLFVVHFPEGHADLAEQSLEILEKGLAEYSAKLESGDQPIHLYVCVTIDEFRQLGGAIAQRGVQGFTNSRAGTIVMKAPNLLGPEANYAGVLRHELLHVLLARHVDPANLPRWFNEGLAMILSRENRFSNMFQVARMYTRRQIIDYDALPYVFSEPGNETQFGMAYAQSLSMTKYLRDRVGEDTFWAIVDDLKTKPFDRALAEHAALTPAKLFEEWKGSLWTSALGWSLISGISVFQVGAILLVIGYLRKRRRARRKLKEWAEEEDDETILFPWELEGRDEPYPWEKD